VNAISSLRFRAIIPAAENVRLGGLLLPGQENLGTAGEEVVREVLKVGPDKISRGNFSTPVEISKLTDVFTDTALTGYGCSAKASAKLVGWESRELVVQQDAQSFNVQMGARLAVQPDTLNGRVIITSVLLPRIQVFGCDNPTAGKRLEEYLGQRVIGYRGGIEIDSSEVIGTSKRLAILEIFELNDIAKDRALMVKGIQTQPPGALGYADPIRLAGKTPSSAEDEKFLWIGRTPLDDELDMATGRFYFRLKPNDGSATLTFFRDLTLSDGGKILKLP